MHSQIFGDGKFLDAGFGKNNLLPVSVLIWDANNIPVKTFDVFIATVSGMSPKNEVISCNSIIYVSD